MAQDIDWDKGAYSEPAGSEPDWDKGSYSEPPKPRTRGVFEAINDTVIEGANAAAGGVSAAANFFKPGNAVSEFIDENIIKAGEAKQSDVVRAEKKAMAQGIQEADAIGGELAAVGKYVVNNPALAAAQAAGSFVMPGAAAKVLGRVGGIGAGAAMAGGDAAGTAYDLSKQAGATEDQAVSAGRQASVIPAAVGGVTGAFGAERILAGGKGFAGNAASRALKTGASEAGQEAIEEGVTAFEGQRAAMPYDATIDPTKGVAAAAGMGAVMGGAAGAGVSLLSGGSESAPTKATSTTKSAGAQAFASGQPMTPPAEIKSVAEKAQWVRDWQDAAAASMTTAPGAAGQGDAVTPSGDVLPEVPGGMAGVQRTFDPRAGGRPPISMLQTDAGGNAIDFEASPEFDRNFKEFPPLKENEPTRMLGFNPLAGTPRVYPDGTVALGSDQDEFTKFVPSRATQIKRSEQMGLNPAAGPMSAAAATAVDSGAYDQAQQQTAMAQAAEVAAQEAKQPAKKYAHRVNGTLNGKPFQTMVMAASTDEAMVAAVKASPGLQPSAAEPVSKSVATQPATSGETTLDPQAIETQQGRQKEQKPAADTGGIGVLQQPAEKEAATKGLTNVSDQTKATASMAQASEPETQGPSSEGGSRESGPASSVRSEIATAPTDLKPPRGILAKKAKADAERAARNSNGQTIQPATEASPDAGAVAPPAVRSAGVSGVDEQGAVSALSGTPSDQSIAAEAVKKADELGLKGSDRRQWVADSLSASFGMTPDEAIETTAAVEALKKRPSADSKTKATERFVESVVRQAEAANVQNPQSRPAGAETQAAPVETPAPAGSNAAAAAGVSAAPGAGDVQADGVKIAEAAHQAATSHKNDLPQPTEAQKEAGNYSKGHITINGLDISIENPAGSKRRPEWPALKNHYGYFKGSIGADKDHVDVFMTDRAGDASLPVFVVDQTNRDGTFDEHKIIMGTADEAEARATYLQNYEKGWTGLGAITQMTQDEFKAWVRDPAKTKKPVALKRGVLAKMAEQKAKAARRKSEDIRDSRWESMNLSERERVAEAIGRKGIFAQKLAEKRWDRIDAEVKAKLREVLDAQEPAQPQPKPEPTAKAPPAEPVKPEPPAKKPASKSEFKVDRTFLPPPTEEEFSKGARYIIGSNGAKERIEYPGAAIDAGQADDAFMGAKNDEPRTLVAMHNLTAENLLYADSMGGIPVPSIGITKIDTPFSGFGDVTLIAPSSMVDPEQGTPVFDRDAWTARFPTMNFKKVKAKVADAFYERMKPARQIGDDGDSFTSLLWEQLRNANVQSPDKVADLFRRYNAAKLFYAKEVLGKDIKVPMKSAPLSSPAANDKQLQAYWKKNGQRLVEIDRELSGFEFSNSPEYKAFIAEVEGAVRRYAESTGRPERADSYVSMFLPDGSLGPGGFRNLKDDFDKVGEKVVDGIKFNELIRKAVPDNDQAYQAWVKSLVEPLFETPTITVRGREVAPTLDNIVESMTIGATQGAEKSLTFGPGKTAAMLGKRFKSMAEIKAARDQVVSQAAEADSKKATEAILDEYRTRVASSYKYTDWRGNIDTWAANDAAMEALAKAGKAGGSNADIRQALVRAGFKLADQTTIDLASQSIKALRNAATDYFEAKPQRAVKLNEFRGAVIPKGASQEVKDILTKNGIEFIEFNKSADGARDAAIQKMAKRVDKAAKDILFAGDKGQQAQGTPTDRAVMAMAGEGKSADEILRFIANASKSPFNRQMANLLRRTKANPAVSIGGDMGGGAGFKFLAKYSRKNHEVTLSEGASGKAEQIFLHETVHAATLLALDRGGEHAARMKALYESVKAQGLADAYGMKNVGEFVAEAFTNPEFQKVLKGYKAPGGTAWDRFVAAVRRILGLADKSQDALSAALELGVEVMRENMPLRSARSFSAEDAPAFAGSMNSMPENQAPGPQGDAQQGADKGNAVTAAQEEANQPADGFTRLYHAGSDPTKGGYFKEVPSGGVFDGMFALRDRWGNYGTGAKYFADVADDKVLTQHDLDYEIDYEKASEALRDVMPWVDEDDFDTAWKSVIEDKADRIDEDDLLRIMRESDIGSAKWEAQRRRGMVAKALGYQAVEVDDENGTSILIVSGTPLTRVIPNDQSAPVSGGASDDAFFGMADAASLKNSALEQIKQFDVKTAPKNTWAHYRGMAMQALGRRQIVDLYAEELPQLEHYNDLVQRMDAEKNESGAEADNLAQEWGKLKNGEDRTLAELMHDATLAQMDPSKAQEPGTLTIQYKALESRYKAMTPEAKALFAKARDMYKDHYTAVQKAIKERIERSEMSDGQKRKIMARMDEELFKELKGVYFPLARFGQYVIVVKDANGEVKNVTRSETVKEAETARKELQKAFPAHMGNTVGKVLKQAEFNAGRDAVGKGFMADLMGALDKNGIDDELRDTVAQLYLSSLPDLSWAKHGIHRKGTPGFSQDARRAFAQNMFHGARYLAKLRYADQLQDQLTAMQDHIKAYEGVEEYDSVEAQQVVDEMVKRHEFMMNPKSSPVSTALTSFGFLFHMGLSPASAMVNLTQTALVAFPQMGAKWGFGKASAALIKASEETVRAKNDLSKVLKGDELDALNRAINDGTIDVTMAHDLAGIAQGEDQGVMWKVRPVMRAASFMFHHAEKFNRQATFLAAYRLAKEANPTRAFDRLYEDAQKATYDGHFDYSAGNRPRIMQGNWQKVIFLFKQYATNMLYTLSRNAYQSVKALDPKERAQARKTLAGLLAAHAAAAGVLGLPIVGQLLTIASFLGSDDDEPWDAEVAMQNAMAELLGPKAAEVMARGLSRLTPWDLSGRVALNKLILPDVQEGLEGKAWAESAMAAALGPVAGIGVNVARGMQKITDGDYMRGIEDMLPTALRGPIKAMRYANEGAVDKTGIVITDEVSAAGVIGQASGFSPSQVRRDTERRSAIYSYDKALTDRRSVLMRMFADAQMKGDTETVQDVRQDIAAFNEKNPNRRITVPNLMQSVRNRQRRIDQAQDGIYLPKNRRDALDAVTF